MTTLAALQVLGEPRRQAILELLHDGERPVGELVEQLQLSQPAVSKHLRVLKQAGLVEARTDAQRRLYHIRPEPLAELDDWLAPYRPLWAAPSNFEPSLALRAGVIATEAVEAGAWRVEVDLR